MKLFRFKHLKDHTAGNSFGRRRDSDSFTMAVKNHVLSTKFGGSSDKICPVFLLPLLITVIFVFTIAQIFMIHRTIEAYKLRDQAYRDCYYPNENGGALKNGTGSGNGTTLAAQNSTTSFVLPASKMNSTGEKTTWSSESDGNAGEAKLTHKVLLRLPKANYD